MDALPTHAWLHQCGALNPGTFDEAVERSPGTHASCPGCRTEIKGRHEVTAEFLLLSQLSTIQLP